MADQRWGLTLPLPGISLPEHAEHVRRAEGAGYTDLWTGETNGPDGFTPLALSAAWTEEARLGTGIVGVFQRGPALLETNPLEEGTRWPRTIAATKDHPAPSPLG